MARMKAVVVREHGGPEQLVMEERPDPRPGPGEVTIKVEATALNHLDLWVRKGVPGHPYPLPLIPGCDLAGTVAEVGPGVTGVEKGQPAAVSPGLSCGRCKACLQGRDHRCRGYGIFGETRDGGYAEYCVVPAANLLPKPEGLSFAETASIPLATLTAWHMLVERARIQPGEWVLIQAGASGVGSAAVQIARLWGCRVVATAGSPEKRRLAEELGAHHTVDYRERDMVKDLRQIVGRRGVDVVFEHVGGEVFAQSVRSLAWAGRLVTCGCTAGYEVPLNLRHLFFKSLSLLGSTMGSKAELFTIMRHVEAGDLRPVVDRVYPLEEAAEAHRRLEARQALGKVVLQVGAGSQESGVVGRSPE